MRQSNKEDTWEVDEYFDNEVQMTEIDIQRENNQITTVFFDEFF